MPKSSYIHGAHPEEQERLGIMNRLLNDEGIARLSLAPGDFVLDVGCGTAIFARRMAEEVGEEGRVLGIERDPAQIAEAKRLARGDDARVEIRQGDALAPPLREEEQGSFDVVHTRFLLEHLPDPIAAVRQMMKAVRPGGRVVLTDEDHETLRLHPEPAGFARLWEAYWRRYESAGNDPSVGRKLVALLHGAGAERIENDCLFFGACAGSARFGSFVANLVGVIESARGSMTASGAMTDAGIDEALEAIHAWSRLPDAAAWYTVSWAQGRRPI
jgi:ubiquinone/menaquinone biosynthesis C-methylase UbiE